MWITEQREVDGPIVYGYMQLRQYSPDRHAALAVTIDQYSHAHELQLCGIFTGREGVADDPAFSGLLDVLALSGAYAVVLPTAHHLGSRQVARRRRKQIQEIGARLLFVRGVRDHGTAAPSTALRYPRGGKSSRHLRPTP
ncbi:hypothetical protein ACOZ38_28540 [Sphaerisporangium viridialbum]|uniref:hypothetical protein n=1 Tax=Sphaerisporangium viridialbum TaxID=46189 RepID=UPI003C77EABE